MPHRITRDDGGFVRSQGPSVVVAIPVGEGDEVQAGEVVAVLESMKMESSLTAQFRGRVRRVLVGPNVHVAAQEPLLQIEPDEDGDRVAVGAGERPDPEPGDPEEPEARRPARQAEDPLRLAGR